MFDTHISDREWSYYNMSNEAYWTATEFFDSFDFERVGATDEGAIVPPVQHALDRIVVNGDLEAYEELFWFYGSCLGACNNV